MNYSRHQDFSSAGKDNLSDILQYCIPNNKLAIFIDFFSWFMTFEQRLTNIAFMYHHQIRITAGGQSIQGDSTSSVALQHEIDLGLLNNCILMLPIYIPTGLEYLLVDSLSQRILYQSSSLTALNPFRTFEQLYSSVAFICF